jgi:phage terminase large subunit
MEKKINIYDFIGKGYEKFWNFKGRYRLIKGSRNSKKSVIGMGYRIIMDILENKYNNVLVIRQIDANNRQSTFANVVRWLSIMGIENHFKVINNPLKIMYKPTGQVIIFRGMNQPTSLTSITVETGVLSKVYIEEAFEIKSYDDFRKLDGSIRGVPPPGVYYQLTMIFNPWNIDSWLYTEFFKGRLEDDYDTLMLNPSMEYINDDFIGDYGKGLYLMINNYKINEFRDTSVYDIAMLELSRRAPDIFKVEGLGMWGNAKGSCYPEYSEKLIISRGQANSYNFVDYAIGVDTGLSNGEGRVKRDGDVRSATTMQLVGLTSDYSKLVCLNEYFYTNAGSPSPKTEPEIMNEIVDTIIKWREVYNSHRKLMKGVTYVWVDSADIGFRQGLELVARQKGLFNVYFGASTKMKIQTRVDIIRLLMAWDEYLISEACPNLIRELKNSRKGENGDAREDNNDHAINGNEYAWASLIKQLQRWKQFKEH